MTQTYSQIQQKIAKLQKEAEALRRKEIGGVIARIKVAIEHYGLTAEHLFGRGRSGSVKASGKANPAGKTSSGAKYSDGSHSWTGYGPRPRWLRDAIAGGASLESFLAAGGPLSGKASATAKPAKAFKRAPSAVVYLDGAGNSWTGRGPQPRWLKDAIAAGRTLESLRGSPEEAPLAASKASSRKSAKTAARFKDGAGNSWSGRGPQPRWLKEALASGKSLEDLRG